MYSLINVQNVQFFYVIFIVYLIVLNFWLQINP